MDIRTAFTDNFFWLGPASPSCGGKDAPTEDRGHCAVSLWRRSYGLYDRPDSSELGLVANAGQGSGVLQQVKVVLGTSLCSCFCLIEYFCEGRKRRLRV